MLRRAAADDNQSELRYARGWVRTDLVVCFSEISVPVTLYKSEITNTAMFFKAFQIFFLVKLKKKIQQRCPDLTEALNKHSRNSANNCN